MRIGLDRDVSCRICPDRPALIVGNCRSFDKYGRPSGKLEQPYEVELSQRTISQATAGLGTPMARRIRQRRTVRDQLSRADRTVRHLSSERAGAIDTFSCRSAACTASGEAEGLNTSPHKRNAQVPTNSGILLNERRSSLVPAPRSRFGSRPKVRAAPASSPTISPSAQEHSNRRQRSVPHHHDGHVGYVSAQVRGVIRASAVGKPRSSAGSVKVKTPIPSTTPTRSGPPHDIPCAIGPRGTNAPGDVATPRRVLGHITRCLTPRHTERLSSTQGQHLGS